MKKRTSALLLLPIVLFFMGCSGGSDDPAVDYTLNYDGDPHQPNGMGGMGDDIECLVYFNAAKLASCEGGDLSAIKICYCDFSGNPDTKLHNVRIYGTGTTINPGTILYQHDHTLVKGWNTITLASPVPITALTEIWAGFSVFCSDGVGPNPPADWPVSRDNEANVPGINFFNMGGPYSELTDYNFNVRIVVTK
ncbi:MAG: hypothetical protein EPN93_21225 [Spirochaetes bacterium]|nr:MAG: hypothetical protein EPN93_21225 [Spirochaetota bacterium]